YRDNGAMWPAMPVLPLAVVIHIYLLVTLRPKWPLVGYAAVHLSALLLISIICLMRISKDSLCPQHLTMRSSQPLAAPLPRFTLCEHIHCKPRSLSPGL